MVSALKVSSVVVMTASPLDIFCLADRFVGLALVAVCCVVVSIVYLYWGQGFLEMLLVYAKIAPLLVVVIFSFLTLYPSQHCEIERVKAVFETSEMDLVYPSCYVNRSAVLERLTETIMGFGRPRGTYLLVEGARGIGKTTILKLAVKAVKATGRNVIYLSMQSREDFSLLLAETFSIDMNCEASPASFVGQLLTVKSRVCPKTWEARTRLILRILVNALKIMQMQKYPVPTLIIDHVNVVFQEKHPNGTPLLSILQMFAKEMADDYLVTVLFAASEGQVYDYLLLHDWWFSHLMLSQTSLTRKQMNTWVVNVIL